MDGHRTLDQLWDDPPFSCSCQYLWPQTNFECRIRRKRREEPSDEKVQNGDEECIVDMIDYVRLDLAPWLLKLADVPLTTLLLLLLLPSFLASEDDEKKY